MHLDVLVEIHRAVLGVDHHHRVHHRALGDEDVLPAPSEGAGLLDSGISNIVALACGAAGTPWALLDERAVLGREDYDGSGDLHPGAGGYTNLALRLRTIIKEKSNAARHP